MKDNKRTRDLRKLKSKKVITTIRREMDDEDTDENPWFRYVHLILYHNNHNSKPYDFYILYMLLKYLRKQTWYFAELSYTISMVIRERECILLLLQARMMFREMLQIKMKQERIASGDLSVSEIQNLLQSQEEEQSTDWISGNHPSPPIYL